MKNAEYRSVEVTREIRAKHAEQLRGASPEERIQFYREKARWAARREVRERITLQAKDS